MLQYLIILFSLLLPVLSLSGLKNEVCNNGYEWDCLKLNLLSIASKLDKSFHIGPGLYLNHDPTVITSLEYLDGRKTEKFLRSTLNFSAIHDLLNKSIKKYLQSLALSVKLVDSSTVHMASSLSSRIMSFTTQSNSTLSRGRRKKGHHQTLIACIGMIAAIGLSTLAALSGKALMTSLLALLLAGASALKHSQDHSAPCAAKTVGIIDAHSRRGPGIERSELAPPFYPIQVNPLDSNLYHNVQTHNLSFN